MGTLFLLILLAGVIALTVRHLRGIADPLPALDRQLEDSLCVGDVPPVRCWCCPGAPMVDDFRIHTKLVHSPRPLGAEDSAEWGARRDV